MSIHQISVFMENKAGRIAEVTGVLAESDVNIFAFSVADTIDYGILRLVVDDRERAGRALDRAGFTSVEHEVLCAEIPNRPGMLAQLAQALAQVEVNLEYMYLGANNSLVFKTENIEGLEQVILGQGFRVLTDSDIAQRRY